MLHPYTVWIRGSCQAVSTTAWEWGYNLASFPGLHAQLLSLAVPKAGEGLEGFITWCMPLLMPWPFLISIPDHSWSQSQTILNLAISWPGFKWVWLPSTTGWTVTTGIHTYLTWSTCVRSWHTFSRVPPIILLAAKWASVSVQRSSTIQLDPVLLRWHRLCCCSEEIGSWLAAAETREELSCNLSGTTIPVAKCLWFCVMLTPTGSGNPAPGS